MIVNKYYLVYTLLYLYIRQIQGKKTKLQCLNRSKINITDVGFSFIKCQNK